MGCDDGRATGLQGRRNGARHDRSMAACRRVLLRDGASLDERSGGGDYGYAVTGSVAPQRPMQTLRSVLAIAACGVGLLAACGGSGGTGAGPLEDAGSDGASAGDSATSDGTTKDVATDGVASGDGGDGGADAGEAGGMEDGGDASSIGDGAVDGGGGIIGHGALGLASAGASCSSTHYSMIVTLGQSPGGNTSSTSTHYRLHGGLVGSTQ